MEAIYYIEEFLYLSILELIYMHQNLMEQKDENGKYNGRDIFSDYIKYIKYIYIL